MMQFFQFGFGLLLATSFWSTASEACTIARNGTATRLLLYDTASEFKEFSSKLDKGLTVTLQHNVFQDDKLTQSFGCRVYYDLWDEQYSLTTAGSNRRVKSLVEVKSACFTSGNFKISGKTIEVETVLNPVSADQLERTKDWLAERGIGESSGAILGRAVGAFVDLKQARTFKRTCER